MTAAAATLEPVGFSAIPGWAADDHRAGLAAFRRSCREMIDEGRGFARPARFGGSRQQWLATCRKALTASYAKAFFETSFQAFRIHDEARPEGLFTGYYEPEAAGSRTPTSAFGVPLYRKPADLVGFDAATEARLGVKYGRVVDGRPMPYYTRRDIEEGVLAGRGLEIAWIGDWADAFFMQVQGSGRVRLADGSAIRLAFAAKTGQPYTGIGGLLAERGAFAREEMSMQATRAWMAQDPKAARQLMWENKSFIFFREVEGADADLGPPGAQKVPLTPLRSLAVDRSLWMFGTPFWLDTRTPSGPKGSHVLFRQLMIAQDTGTAIRGLARGDVFWGAGDHAALVAGHMKSPGSLIVLLPHAVAEGLNDAP